MKKVATPEVYCLADDRDVVLLKWQVTDKKKTEAFLNSPALKERAKAVGVMGDLEGFFSSGA